MVSTGSTCGQRTPLMAGNWKSNLNHQEAVVLVQKLAWTLADKKHDYAKAEVVVHPPFTDLRSVQTLVDGDRLSIKYGAQDVSVHDGGAYTGEISAAMLAKLGLHLRGGRAHRAPRVPRRVRRGRQRQGDQDAAAGMTPIVCVGEGLEIRQAGDHVAYTLAQIDGSLAGFSAEQVAGAGRRLRAGLGDRHRRGGHAGRCPGGLRRDPRPDRGGPRRGRRRRRTHPLRRVGEGREHRRNHGSRPTSTGAWWAVPACRRTSSAESAGSMTCRCCEKRIRDVGPSGVTFVFTILLVISSLILILLVLLHKGRGGGLSDMFGGGVSSSLGGSSVAERNLDRLTVGIGVIWFACIVALGLLKAY